MKINKRIAFLIGAGAVADANIPMSIELAGKLKDTLAKNAGTNDTSTQSVVCNARKLLSAFNFLNGGIRFQEGVLDRDPDTPVNIEQIAVAALELQGRLRNPLAPYTSGWHQRIVELEHENLDLMSTFVDFIYTQLEHWLTINDDDQTSYLARLADIAQRNVGIDLFSLNYDLCIEKAFTAARKPYTNGFRAGVWAPTTLQGNHQIRLFKLHGSLDWVDEEPYGICSLEYPCHPEKDTIKHDNTKPLLIFGTSHKLSPREPFLSLAYHFSQSVLNTTSLVIIGYSFGDDHVNRIIEQGLRKNQKLRIIVVAPSAEQKTQAISFLERQPRVTTINKGAKEALNNNMIAKKVWELTEETDNEEPFT